MKLAVITIVHGRHEHLLRQIRGVRRSTRVPDRYVVVAMDDPSVAGLLERSPVPVVLLDEPSTPLGLPLAAARNRGAATAIAAGADLLVFLDADCIPSPQLLAAYESAAQGPATAALLLCGPVAYLPNGLDPELPTEQLETIVAPHAARPAPPPGAVEIGADHALFWSLSFAVTATVWQRIGGFWEDYSGYGAEDTDFAQTANGLGIQLAFVGGARAFHQYHPTTNPPVQHLADIVRNANLYRRRHGTFPMQGWLDGFEQRGLVERTPDGSAYVETGAGREHVRP